MIIFYTIFLMVSMLLYTCLRPCSSQFPCSNATLDLVLALDDSAGLRDYGEDIQKWFAPRLQRLIISDFPETRIGVVTYNDEDAGCLSRIQQNPMKNYGVRIALPLTDRTDLLPPVFQSYDPSHGHAFSDAQDTLGALLVATKNSQMGWRPKGRKNFRFVAVVTDAPYRYPGDRRRLCNTQTPLRPNDGSGNYDFKLDDFPTVNQVASALKEEEIHTVFLIVKYTWTYHDKVYRRLIEQTGIKGRVEVIKTIEMIRVLANAITKLGCPEPSTTSTTDKPILIERNYAVLDQPNEKVAVMVTEDSHETQTTEEAAEEIQTTEEAAEEIQTTEEAAEDFQTTEEAAEDFQTTDEAAEKTQRSVPLLPILCGVAAGVLVVAGLILAAWCLAPGPVIAFDESKFDSRVFDADPYFRETQVIRQDIS